MRRPITAFALAGLCVLATAAGAETASTGLAPFKIVAIDGSDSIPEPLTDKPGDAAAGAKVVVNRRQGNCLGCHHTGGIAMSLATYDEARPWAKAIKEELLEKRMPPWRAVKGYGEYRNAPPLTQRDIEMIVNWVEGGAPKGDARDLPADALYSDDWLLSKPDLAVSQPAEQKVAADADEYRDFIVETGLRQDRWLSAVNLKPGNHSVVHCAAIGCPLVGEPFYGPERRPAGNLHLLARSVAFRMAFEHDAVSAVAPAPEHMRDALSACGWRGE